MAPSYVDTKVTIPPSREGLLHFGAKNVSVAINVAYTGVPDICNCESKNKRPYHSKNELQVSIYDIYQWKKIKSVV